jgi:acyl-CoA thioester hydrolase
MKRKVADIVVTDQHAGPPLMCPNSSFHVDLRWRDLDHQGHVYHGTILTILDEARTSWLETTIGVLEPDSYVVVRLEIDYRLPLMRADEGVVAHFQPVQIGNSSIRISERMHSARTGKLVAESATTIVMWDRLTSSSRPLSTVERANAVALKDQEDSPCD